MQYCYKCGNQIVRVNETHTCEQCGAHIYGEKDMKARIVNTNTNSIALVKTNEQILSEYLESVYYKFNQEAIEEVLKDTYKTGKYSTELWLKGKQMESDTEALCCPFKLLYSLNLPEPDGSYQVIDMVVITKYCLFVLEIQNQIHTLHIDYWSDSNCVLNGEKVTSPIAKNNDKIIALRNILFMNKTIDIYDSPAVRPMNIIVTSANAKINVSFPYSEWDEYSLDSLDVNLLNGYNLTRQLNIIIKDLKTKEFKEYIDISDIYDVLYKYCEGSNSEKIKYDSNKMRNNSKKHSWEYYMVAYNFNIVKMLRDNGIYREMYFKDTYSKWIFMGEQLDDVKKMFYFKDDKEQIMFLKHQLDKNEKLKLETNEDGEKENVSLNKKPVNTKKHQSEDKIMFCSNCGEKVEEDAVFCSCCGAKIE